MENQPHSPYFNFSMIRNVEMFFGRTALLKRFYAALASRQSVSILGLRRIGKSSFLYCSSQPEMYERFAFDLKSHIFVFLDLHDYLHKSREDFFHSVSQEIIEQSAKVAGLTLLTEEKGADEFSSILYQVVKKGFFPVLLLDSFDKVTQNEHFGPEFLAFCVRRRVEGGCPTSPLLWLLSTMCAIAVSRDRHFSTSSIIIRLKL